MQSNLFISVKYILNIFKISGKFNERSNDRRYPLPPLKQSPLMLNLWSTSSTQFCHSCRLLFNFSLFLILNNCLFPCVCLLSLDWFFVVVVVDLFQACFRSTKQHRLWSSGNGSIKHLTPSWITQIVPVQRPSLKSEFEIKPNSEMHTYKLTYIHTYTHINRR